MAVGERRGLHGSMESQLSASKSASRDNDADTPQSQPTPPTGTDAIPALQATKSYDAFLRYSSNVERFSRFFAGAKAVVTLSTLKRDLPALYRICIDGGAERQHVFEPCRPWAFAFALDTNGGYAALGQAVCFGRALLECFAAQQQLAYRPEWKA
jgi:hypothetical protein